MEKLKTMPVNFQLMKKKFSETRDVIEKSAMDFILSYFPNYAKFWEQFIGINKKPSIDLSPYDLKNRNNIQKFNKMVSIYNNINQYHYSLFINLYFSFLYYQDIQKLTFSVGPGKDMWPDYLKYRRACQSFYLFIGTARDMFGKVINAIMNEEKHKSRTAGSVLEEFDKYLLHIKPGFELQFSQWRSKIGKLRTRIMHYGTIGGLVTSNSFLIPLNLEKDEHWLQDMEKARRNSIDEKAYINFIFKETIRLINLSYNILIKEYEKSLKTSGVEIDY